MQYRSLKWDFGVGPSGKSRADPGRTPWSARVPLDPFFASASSLMHHTGEPARGPAADQGVRPTLSGIG
jgi:hypothetical protein